MCVVCVVCVCVCVTIFSFDWHVRSTFPVNKWTQWLTLSLSFTVRVSFGNGEVSLCIMNSLRVKTENRWEILIQHCAERVYVILSLEIIDLELL